jgi:hypothetical protein
MKQLLLQTSRETTATKNKNTKVTLTTQKRTLAEEPLSLLMGNKMLFGFNSEITTIAYYQSMGSLHRAESWISALAQYEGYSNF